MRVASCRASRLSCGSCAVAREDRVRWWARRESPVADRGQSPARAWRVASCRASRLSCELLHAERVGYHAGHALSRGRIESVGGLVENHQLRTVDNRLRALGELLHAERVGYHASCFMPSE